MGGPEPGRTASPRGWSLQARCPVGECVSGASRKAGARGSRGQRRAPPHVRRGGGSAEGGARDGAGRGRVRASSAGARPAPRSRGRRRRLRAAMGRGWGLLVGLLGALWLLRSGHSEERRPETAAQRCFCQVRRARPAHGLRIPGRGRSRCAARTAFAVARAAGPCDGRGLLASLSRSVPVSCCGLSAGRSRVHRIWGSECTRYLDTSCSLCPGHPQPSRSGPTRGWGTSCSPSLAVVVKRLNDLVWPFRCPGPTALCLCGRCCPLTPRPVFGALSSS